MQRAEPSGGVLFPGKSPAVLIQLVSLATRKRSVTITARLLAASLIPVVAACGRTKSIMATLSTAQTATTTTLTPPSSSHGDANGFQWDFSTTAGKPEVSLFPLFGRRLHSKGGEDDLQHGVWAHTFRPGGADHVVFRMLRSRTTTTKTNPPPSRTARPPTETTEHPSQRKMAMLPLSVRTRQRSSRMVENW